jgi:hypothetical protein
MSYPTANIIQLEYWKSFNHKLNNFVKGHGLYMIRSTRRKPPTCFFLFFVFFIVFFTIYTHWLYQTDILLTLITFMSSILPLKLRVNIKKITYEFMYAFYLIKQKIELLKTKKILMKLLLWKSPSMVLLSYQLMKSS